VAAVISGEEVRPLAAETTTACYLNLGDSECERGTVRDAFLLWTTELLVECYARTRAGADAVLEFAYAALMADKTLAGANPSGDLYVLAISRERAQQGDAAFCHTLRLALTHQTGNNTLA
jgi:hypothetical protein